MAEAKTFRAVVTAILALQGCGSKINQPELNRAAEAAYERAALIYSFDLTEPDKTRAMSIITEPLRDNRGNKADVLEIISYGLDFDDAGLEKQCMYYRLASRPKREIRMCRMSPKVWVAAPAQ